MAFSTPLLIVSHAIDSTNQGTVGGSGQKLTASASAGDLVFVCFGFGLASTPATCTVTDSQSNSYTTYIRADKTTNNTPHSGIAYSVLGTGLASGTDFITVTFSTNVNRPSMLSYKSTPTAGSTVSTDGSNSGTGQQTTSPSSGSITTAGTDDLLVCASLCALSQTLTPGTGWSSPASAFIGTSTTHLDVEYRIESSAGTFTGNGSYGANTDWATSAAAFKATASSAVPSRGRRGFG